MFLLGKEEYNRSNWSRLGWQERLQTRRTAATGASSQRQELGARGEDGGDMTSSRLFGARRRHDLVAAGWISAAFEARRVGAQRQELHGRALTAALRGGGEWIRRGRRVASVGEERGGGDGAAGTGAEDAALGCGSRRRRGGCRGRAEETNTGARSLATRRNPQLQPSPTATIPAAALAAGQNARRSCSPLARTPRGVARRPHPASTHRQNSRTAAHTI